MRRGLIPQRPVAPEPEDDGSSSSFVDTPSSPTPGQKRTAMSDEAADIGDRLEDMHMTGSGSGSAIGSGSPLSATLTPNAARKIRLKTSSCSGLPTIDMAISPMAAGPFSAESTPVRSTSASPSASLSSMTDLRFLSEFSARAAASATISAKESERRAQFETLMSSVHWVVLEKFLDPEWMRTFRATTRDPVVAREDVYGMKDVFELLENSICKPLETPQLAYCPQPNLAVVSKHGHGTRTAARSIASGAGTTQGPMFNVLTYRFLHPSETSQGYGFFHDVYRIAEENAPCLVIIHRLSQRAGVLTTEGFSRLYESLFRAQETRSDATRTPSVWTLIVDAEPPGKFLHQFDSGVIDTPIIVEPLVKEDLVHYAMSRIALSLRPMLHEETDIQEMLAVYREPMTNVLLKNIEQFTQPMRDIKDFVERLFAVVTKRRDRAALRQDKLDEVISVDALPSVPDFESALASFRTAKMGQKAAAAERERLMKEEQKAREQQAFLSIIGQSQNSAGHSPATASNHHRNPPPQRH